MENLFFDIKDLKHFGKNSIIGKTVRIRYPELVSIGDNCIIDDFTYISTQLTLENYCHISSGCKFIGGQKSEVSMDMLSTTAPNVVLSAGNDDYVSGIGTPLISDEENLSSFMILVSIVPVVIIIFLDVFFDKLERKFTKTF